jgi:hypothetical protein
MQFIKMQIDAQMQVDAKTQAQTGQVHLGRCDSLFQKTHVFNSEESNDLLSAVLL